MSRAAAAGVLLALAAAAPASAQFDPVYEAKNFSKTNERAAIHSTPEYQALLAQVSTANTTEAGQIAAADPERSFVGQTACWTCAGRTIRMRVPASSPRGAYRVTITARPVGAPPQTLRLTALRH